MSARNASIETELITLLPPPAWRLEVWNELSSTMDRGKDMSLELKPETWGVVQAVSQISGRGRQGRVWNSPDGGLFVTFVIPSVLEVSRLGGFSLVVGCAIERVVKGFGGGVLLKWPNDVLTKDGRKICGILVEIDSRGKLPTVLVGIGVNLSETPKELQQSGSLKEVVGPVNRVSLLGSIAQELRICWARFCDDGFAAFREEWLNTAAFLGTTVTVDIGSNVVTGKYVGVDTDGAMLLSVNGREERILSGHFLEAR